MAKKKKKVKKSQKIIGALIIVIALLCFVVGGIYILFDQYYGSTDYVGDDEVTIDQDVVDQLESQPPIFAGLSKEELEEIDDLLNLPTTAPDAPENPENPENPQNPQTPPAPQLPEITANTYNILLIGVDVRDVQWHGNSDTMILLTVNHDTNKIYMTSFMRDLYANIPGYGVRKLNAAHAIGGGPLLVQTIQANYGVKIDNYARVDFSSLTAIIDIAGGVDIELSEAEVISANGNIAEQCALQGKDYEANRIKAAGMQHLNGIQAVGYCRIRNVGNADYGRTARQREVLMALVNRAKSMSVGQLNTLINQVLPLVTHNVEQGTVLNLISQVPSFLSYEFVTGRVPYDGLFTSKNEILIPNMAETIKRLRETLYADK